MRRATAAGRFGVNLIASDQQDIVRRFTDPRFKATRFDALDWQFKGGDVPVIMQSQASLACRKSDRLDYTSHSIVIGEVVEAIVRKDDCLLFYVDGGYARHVASDA